MARLGEPQEDSDRFSYIGSDSYMHTEGLRRTKQEHLCGRQTRHLRGTHAGRDVHLISPNCFQKELYEKE